MCFCLERAFCVLDLLENSKMTDSSATEDLDLEVEAVFQLSAEGVTPEKIKLFEEGQKE